MIILHIIAALGVLKYTALRAIIYCISSAWYPPKKYHRVKIHYDNNDNDYIVVRGYKVPLNECIRFDTMW